MDNIAHTLAGVALGEAGLKRMTALGTATLVIGANFPDVDAITLFVGGPVDAFVVRRGWTHGILALVVLPFVLAGIMIAWDRLVRRRLYATPDPVRPLGLLILAAVGIWSHTLLDLVNSYGVRLLMPFSERWFYLDALFVLDPLIWGGLGVGVLLARRRAALASVARAAPSPIVLEVPRAERPARVALVVVGAYILAMAVSSYVGRSIVERQAIARSAIRTMVAPLPLEPMRRRVVRDHGTWYEIGDLTFWPRPRYEALRIMRTGAQFPQAVAAANTEMGAGFLSWARFPRFDIGVGRAQDRVTITDIRYADEGMRGWATVTISLPREWPEGEGR